MPAAGELVAEPRVNAKVIAGDVPLRDFQNAEIEQRGGRKVDGNGAVQR
jgi:hypothetical protein